MRVFKYPLTDASTQVLQLPIGADILDVQEQQAQLVLWALVDPTAPTEERIIQIVGTGNPAPSDLGRFLATVQHDAGRSVAHVFVAVP